MIYVREKPDPNYDSLRHDKCDIVTKDTIKTFPEYILQSVLASTDFTFLEFADGEFITVDVRRTDSLIKVRLNDEIVLVHIEFQVDDSTSTDMVRRNVGYLGRCYECMVCQSYLTLSIYDQMPVATILAGIFRILLSTVLLWSIR